VLGSCMSTIWIAAIFSNTDQLGRSPRYQ